MRERERRSPYLVSPSNGRALPPSHCEFRENWEKREGDLDCVPLFSPETSSNPRPRPLCLISRQPFLQRVGLKRACAETYASSPFRCCFPGRFKGSPKGRGGGKRSAPSPPAPFLSASPSLSRRFLGEMFITV